MAVLLTVWMLACGGSKEAEPEPPAEATEEAAPADAAPEAAPAPTAEDACVKECLDGRRAEAIAWEEIERQCQAQCDGTAPSLEGGGLE